MTIENIIKSGEDEEIIKYRILSSLKNHVSLFRKNKLYPSLTELVNSIVKLENMISLPLEIKGTGFSQGAAEDEVIFTEFNLEEEDDFSELVKWAIVQVNAAIDEGIPIYEFVDDHMEIIRINGMIINNTEGYLIVPDKTKGAINIYFFESVNFNSSKTPVHSIRVKFLQRMFEDDLIYKTTDPSIKTIMDFVGDNKANVFLCHADLDLPFEETILPLAKKSLLKQLSL